MKRLAILCSFVWLSSCTVDTPTKESQLLLTSSSTVVCSVNQPVPPSESLGQQVGAFFSSPLSTTLWPPRWQCGTWSPFHGWLYILSDATIAFSYFLIPLILLYFLYQRKQQRPFQVVMWLFVSFILACGLTHLIDASIFWWPAYRLSALVRFVTASVSLATVFALVKVTPQLLQLKSPDALEKIVKEQTEELRKQMQLIKSYRQALDESSIVAITDRHGVIEHVNENFSKTSGYSKDEILGKNLRVIFSEEHDSLWEAMGNGRIWKGELENRKKDDTRYWVDSTFVPFLNEEGKCYQCMAIWNNITERKNAEKKNKVNESRILKAQQIGKLGYWQQELGSDTIWASKEAMNIYGFPAADGELPIEVIAACVIDLELARQAAINLIHHNAEYNIEIRINPADGSEMRYISARAELERDSKGIPLRLVGTLQDITERKRTQALIIQNEKRFRALIENSTDGLTVINTDGIVIEMSPSGRKILGYEAHELIGKNSPELIHPDDRDSVLGAFQEIIVDPTRIRILEYRHKMPDGSDKWLECTFHNLLNEPNINAIVLNYRDISERKEKEEIIQRNELRLVQAQAVAKVGSWETDLVTLHVIWSLETYNIFELNPDDFQDNHSSFLKYVHPEDKATVEKAFVESITKSGIHSIEHRILTGKGTEKWVLECWQVFRDATGAPHRAVGTCQDITERKKAEQTIRDSEQQLNLIYNTSSDSIFLIEVKNGRYYFNTVNKTFLVTTGLQIEQVLGRLVDEVIPEPSLSLVLANYQAAISTKKSFEWEEETVYPAGKKIGIVTITPVFNELDQCTKLVGTVHDITERKRAEEQIRTEKYFSESLINSLPGIFYLYDQDGRFARWNKNFETISGYSAEEISHMHPLDFYDVDEKKLMQRKIEKVFTAGDEEVTAHFYTKDKRKIPYYFNGHKILFNGINYLIGVGIDVTERTRAEQELAAYTQEIKKLTAHLESVREEERTRIAREIHDELGQQLTGLKMDASWLCKKIGKDEKAVHEKLAGMISLMDHTVKTIRRISSDLRPGILDDLGLVAALEWQCSEFSGKNEIMCSFTSEIQEDVNFERNLATTIFRIYQESLTNIMRHARASRVEASLKQTDTSIILMIADNGQGFDVDEVKAKGTLGLIGIRERALMAGITVEILSEKGIGTRVILKIPVALVKPTS